jgi:hypothetical protein
MARGYVRPLRPRDPRCRTGARRSSDCTAVPTFRLSTSDDRTNPPSVSPSVYMYLLKVLVRHYVDTSPTVVAGSTCGDGAGRRISQPSLTRREPGVSPGFHTPVSGERGHITVVRLDCRRLSRSLTCPRHRICSAVLVGGVRGTDRRHSASSIPDSGGFIYENTSEQSFDTLGIELRVEVDGAAGTTRAGTCCRHAASAPVGR